MRAWGLMVVGLFLFAACQSAAGEGAPTTQSKSIDVTSTSEPSTTSTVDPRSSMSAEALDYLEEALTAMRTHSINSASIDWDSLEAAALRAATGAKSPAQTYGAINLALNLLNDEHSIFLGPTEAGSFQHGEPVFVPPVVEVRHQQLGYVSIGRFLGDIGPHADEYAADLAARIDGLTGQVCGWILDLQLNTGGNMWPMLAGLAPLLTKGDVGAFTYPNGTVEQWSNSGAVLFWDAMPMTTNARSSPNYVDLPIAVLVGGRTASSGEAVAVAFHGQTDTILIGQPTAGLTTSNEPVELSDGAIIALTMSSFTDRNGVQFGQGTAVEPDLQSAPSDAESSAVSWLRTQPACA